VHEGYTGGRRDTRCQGSGLVGAHAPNGRQMSSSPEGGVASSINHLKKKKKKRWCWVGVGLCKHHHHRCWGPAIGPANTAYFILFVGGSSCSSARRATITTSNRACEHRVFFPVCEWQQRCSNAQEKRDLRVFKRRAQCVCVRCGAFAAGLAMLCAGALRFAPPLSAKKHKAAAGLHNRQSMIRENGGLTTSKV